MRTQMVLIFILINYADAFIWLPFANLGSMFETLKQTAFHEKMDFAEPDSAYSFLELGKELFNGIGQFITSSIGNDDKVKIASNLREIFNLTTTTTSTTTAATKTPKRFRPKIIPVDKPRTTTLPTPKPIPYTLPATTPYFFTTSTTPEPISTTYDPKPRFRFSTTTEPEIIKFIRTTKPPATTTTTATEKSDTTDDGIIRFTTTTEKVRFATFSPNIPSTKLSPTTTTTPIPTTTRTTTTPVPSTTTTTSRPVTTFSTTQKPRTASPVVVDPPKMITRPNYQIWPTTTTRPIIPTQEAVISTTENYIRPSSVIRNNVWKKVTPSPILEYTTSVVYTTHMPVQTDSSTSSISPTTPEPETPTTITWPVPPSESQSIYSTTAGIPFIIKAKKFTRPPINEKIVATTPATSKYDTCVPDQRCLIKLKSFETLDPLFQYCYSHSTMIDDSIQDLLRDTQTAAVLPQHISWHSSVTPEVVQLVQTLMSLYRPSRCLVIGVFTGLGLLGIAERVDSRGIVVALEHPAYAIFWDKVGQKHARKLTATQMSRIQMRTSESIEKSLSRLAANEPNTFDFIFLDDFKRENYLDDYEHAIRLLRTGGLLIINQALNGGGVMSSIDHMTNDDRVIRNMNIRIKQDSRVLASLLPYGGGTWIAVKN